MSFYVHFALIWLVNCAVALIELSFNTRPILFCFHHCCATSRVWDILRPVAISPKATCLTRPIQTCCRLKFGSCCKYVNCLPKSLDLFKRFRKKTQNADYFAVELTHPLIRLRLLSYLRTTVFRGKYFQILQVNLPDCHIWMNLNMSVFWMNVLFEYNYYLGRVVFDWGTGDFGAGRLIVRTRDLSVDWVLPVYGIVQRGIFHVILCSFCSCLTGQLCCLNYWGFI